MIELEEMWTIALSAAEQRARELGRGDAFDYLALREINDAARRVGIEWLFDTFLAVATEANRRGLNLTIEKSDADGAAPGEKSDAHSFAVGSATMRGAFLRLRAGIRSITVEAGFPRTPQDGFVRGNGLACARVSHFGMPRENADLLLIRPSDQKKSPTWFLIGENQLREQFSVAHLEKHFAAFLRQI